MELVEVLFLLLLLLLVLVVVVVVVVVVATAVTMMIIMLDLQLCTLLMYALGFLPANPIISFSLTLTLIFATQYRDAALQYGHIILILCLDSLPCYEY